MAAGTNAHRYTNTETPSPGAVAKIGYSVGNIGKSIVWTSFDVFLLYYLVRIAGFPSVTAGSLLTVMMVADGCADVIVAGLADRRKRSASLSGLILVGAPLCGIGFWLIFTLPPGGSRYAVIVAVLLCRIGYTMCDIGHNTLLVRIAVTPRDATIVSGMRLIFSALGAGLVGWAATIILAPGASNRHGGFATAALVGGAVHIVTLLIARGATRHLPAPGARASPGGSRVGEAAWWHDRPYQLILALIAVQASLVPLFNRALPFLGESVYGSAAWAGTAVAIITASQALSLPMWMTLARQRPPASILILAFGLMLLALGSIALRTGGMIEVAGLSLVGVAQAGINMAIWALLAVTVRHAAGGNAGNEALPVGMFLAVLKTSAGIGNALIVVAISTIDQCRLGCVDNATHPLFIVALLLPTLGCTVGVYLTRMLRRLDTADQASRR